MKEKIKKTKRPPRPDWIDQFAIVGSKEYIQGLKKQAEKVKKEREPGKKVSGTFFAKRGDGCRDIRFPDRYSEIGYPEITKTYERKN